jgi:hypothetical protein
VANSATAHGVVPDSRLALTSRNYYPASGSSAAGPSQRPASAQPAAASASSSATGAAKPASSKPAVAKPAVAKPATGASKGGRPATAKPAAQPAAKHSAAPSKPYLVYDSVAPTAVPSGQKMAAYADGTYQASWSQVAGHGKVVWIDVTGYNAGADALDVEPGDATPAGAAAWVAARLSKYPDSNPIVYTFKSDWGAVISNIDALPAWMHSHVKYWIADPTGYPHILPGASATQWFWGPSYDISSAYPGFTK